MRMQDTRASCGVYALYNALFALGITRSPEELAILCKTTATDGTSPAKLFAAAGKIDGTQPWRISTSNPSSASGLLFFALMNGRPAIASVDRGEHWVSVVGHLQSRLLVADAAQNDLVLSLNAEDFMKRWNCGGRNAFYAVVL